MVVRGGQVLTALGRLASHSEVAAVGVRVSLIFLPAFSLEGSAPGPQRLPMELLEHI
jgi:hypothetical protein